MQANKIFKEITENICRVLPANLQDLKKDLEKNVRAIVSNAFNKLELITREEFDTQTKVLARTRQKIEALEKHIHALEKTIQDTNHE